MSSQEINCPIAAEKAKSPIVKCKPTGNKDEIYGTTLSDKTFQALFSSFIQYIYTLNTVLNCRGRLYYILSELILSDIGMESGAEFST